MDLVYSGELLLNLQESYFRRNYGGKQLCDGKPQENT